MFVSIGRNKFKTVIIVLMVTMFLMGIVYFIANYSGIGVYAIPIAVVIAVVTSFTSYYYSDKIILSMSSAVPADKQTYRQVREAMEGLCIAAGLPMPRVYVMNDKVANAFATGRNPENAVVCVTTGLLEKLDYYELEAVLAHELAHIGNRDILLSTVVTVMVGIGIILSDIFRRTIFFRMGAGRRGGGRGGNPIMMIIGLLLLIMAPIAGMLMKMALSRNREYLADVTAVQYTRNPDGLASALAKLGGQTESVMTASTATSHMYIVNPFAEDDIAEMRESGTAAGLFSTHPPIAKRIEAIRNLR
jgi:heat shock protein HtpX